MVEHTMHIFSVESLECIPEEFVAAPPCIAYYINKRLGNFKRGHFFTIPWSNCT